MIRVYLPTKTAERVPVPYFLFGLLPESLKDLSWTDPALGVRDYAWWPEVQDAMVYDENTHELGAEILIVDSLNMTVHVSHEVVPIKPETIAQRLADAKTAKNMLINQWRLEANKTTFPHAGKTIACDDLSRSDIDAVANTIALTGAFPPSFPGAWKATDNTYLPLPDVAAFKAMFASMTAQGTANFNKSQQLKATLAAAKTVAEVNAIVW